MVSTVRDILDGKGREVWSISPDTIAYDALQQMADRDVGAMLVMDGDRLVGIFSERDYARKVILKGKSSRETPVRDLMTQEVVCVSPMRSVEQCMALMTDKHVRHLPVVENDHVVGVVSIGDVVGKIIANHQFMIQELIDYISGRT